MSLISYGSLTFFLRHITCPTPHLTSPHPNHTHTQDTKLASLERNIRDLEDEIQTMKTNGLLHTDGREEFKHVEVYKNHSKFMKSKTKLKSALPRFTSVFRHTHVCPLQTCD
ncbi:unnamed protein product [Leuciscus chuanchicus]